MKIVQCSDCHYWDQDFEQPPVPLGQKPVSTGKCRLHPPKAHVVPVPQQGIGGVTLRIEVVSPWPATSGHDGCAFGSLKDPAVSN